MGATAPAGFPCGRRTPKGTLRWYLALAPHGREVATCEKLKKVVDPTLLEDAFVVSAERWFHRNGIWSLRTVQLWPGYLMVASRDAAGLDRALAKLSFPVQLAGTENHAFAPMAADAQRWYASCMDAAHVLRNSVAVIEGGTLRVEQGPLIGQEPRMFKINRHKRSCLVGVCDSDGGFTQSMPLDVPFKN